MNLSQTNFSILNLEFSLEINESFNLYFISTLKQV